MLAMLRRCLCRDVYGSTMPFFAIGSSVLLGAAGLAVDLGRGELARADLQRAVDAAALATVASVVRSGDYLDDGSALDADTVALMKSIVRANLDRGWGDIEVAISHQVLPEDSGLRVHATASLPTTLMRVLSDPSTRIRIAADDADACARVREHDHQRLGCRRRRSPADGHRPGDRYVDLGRSRSAAAATGGERFRRDAVR